MAKRDITKRPRRALSADERQQLFREFKLGIFALIALVVLVVALRDHGRSDEAKQRVRTKDTTSGTQPLRVVWKPRAARGKRPSGAPRREEPRRPETPGRREPERRVRPAPPLPRPAYRNYVVKRGDRLWKIAEKYYGNGRYWRRIAKANPGVNPRKLKRGTILRIPLRGSATALAGRPRLAGGDRLLHVPTQ